MYTSLYLNNTQHPNLRASALRSEPQGIVPRRPRYQHTRRRSYHQLEHPYHNGNPNDPRCIPPLISARERLLRDGLAQKLAHGLPGLLGAILEQVIFWHDGADMRVMPVEAVAERGAILPCVHCWVSFHQREESSAKQGGSTHTLCQCGRDLDRGLASLPAGAIWPGDCRSRARKEETLS